MPQYVGEHSPEPATTASSLLSTPQSQVPGHIAIGDLRIDDAEVAQCRNRDSTTVLRIHGDSPQNGEISAVISLDGQTVTSVLISTESSVRHSPAVYMTSTQLDGQARAEASTLVEQGYTTFTISGVAAEFDDDGRAVTEVPIELVIPCQSQP